jgi:hypothetical protein
MQCPCRLDIRHFLKVLIPGPTCTTRLVSLSSGSPQASSACKSCVTRFSKLDSEGRWIWQTSTVCLALSVSSSVPVYTGSLRGSIDLFLQPMLATCCPGCVAATACKRCLTAGHLRQPALPRSFGRGGKHLGSWRRVCLSGGKHKPQGKTCLFVPILGITNRPRVFTAFMCCVGLYVCLYVCMYVCMYDYLYD